MAEADSEAGETTESSMVEENGPWNHTSETRTSITTRTTTTSTTTISHKPSKSKLRPKQKPKRSRPPSRRSTRSKSTDSFHSRPNASRYHSNDYLDTDPYLDALLARSLAALELSNSLLQSTMATKSTLSTVLDREEQLERQQQAWEKRLVERGIRELRSMDAEGFLGRKLGQDDVGMSTEPPANEGGKKKREWMDEIESLVRDVETLFDVQTDTNATSNDPFDPAGSHVGPPHTSRRTEGTGLVLGDHESTTTAARSPPPRALTQLVSVTGSSSGTMSGAGLGKSVKGDIAEDIAGQSQRTRVGRGGGGFASESTADKDSIYLPSTVGNRSGGHHRERFVPTPSPSNASTISSSGTWKTQAPVIHGHNQLPSSASVRSDSSNRRDEPSLTRRSTPPPTHPEALPLSTQELLQLQLQAEKRPNLGSLSSTSPREHLTKYLRAPSATSSARGTQSKRLENLKDVQHAQTPSTVGFTSFIQPDSQQQHERTISNASSYSHSTHSTKSSLSSFYSGRRPSLPLSPPSPIGTNFRRSPSIRSSVLLSPSASTTSSRERERIETEQAPIDWYSPSLEAIPDHQEDGDSEFGYASSDLDRGRSGFSEYSFD